jgi:AsmA protein
MKRILKTLILLTGIVVALVLATVLVVPLVIDPNDYREQIAALVKERTGRELVIEGDLQISVFPWLGFEVGAARLSNAPGFEDRPFARVGAANVRVKLVPLLRREVEMDALALSGLMLNLVRDEQGRTNWADLVPEAAAAEPRQREAGGIGALALGGLRVTDAAVLWDDRQSGAHYTFERIDLRTGEFTLGEPVRLNASFDVKSRAPALDARVTIAGIAHADLAAERYRLQGLDVAVLARGEGLPPEGAEARLSAEVAADLAQQTLAVSALRLTAAGVAFTGELSGTEIVDAPRLQGGLRSEPFSPRELLGRLGQPAPQTADPTVLSAAALDLTFSASQEELNIERLTARLDDSALAGSLQVRDFDAPAFAFDLALDRIDLDRYLAPPVEGEEPAVATPTGAAAAAAGELPLETLRGLNAKGELRVGELRVSNLSAADVRLAMDARDGVVRLHPASAQLYQGTYQGDLRIDARGEVPQLSIDERLSGVQIGPLLIDLTGEDTLTGTAELRARITGRGLTAEALRASAAGEASFQFTDGSVNGINIAQILREVEATVRQRPLPAEETPRRTDFAELTGTLKLAKGIIENRDLSAKSPLLRVTGEGTANLVTEEISYLLRPVLVGTLEGQAGRELQELRGVPVPVRVSGSFAAPTIRPDMEAVFAELVRGREPEVRERLEKEIKRGLERLLR